ncbi:hypothetical protein [Sphingobacterium bambusae]|uniref:hypothetical protein n=1 Tax=Sphingobacterium bambusae TaxID=662858 RepID=UPI0036D39087
MKWANGSFNSVGFLMKAKSSLFLGNLVLLGWHSASNTICYGSVYWCLEGM